MEKMTQNLEKVEFLTVEFAFDAVEVLTSDQIDELRFIVSLVNSNLADYPDLTGEQAFKGLIYLLQRSSIPFCGNHKLLQAFEYNRKVSGHRKNLYFKLTNETRLYLYYNEADERFYLNVDHPCYL
jgi:hypothetical protein